MNHNNFAALPLSDELQRAITDLEFTTPSPIQAEAIPHLLEGKDVIGQAQTGTGKTAAFAIPTIERVDSRNRSIQALILCPTRELAVQVNESFRSLGKYKKGLVTMAVYGGQPISKQIQFLKRQPQIIVGTPGRVLDLINRNVLKLGRVKTAILDEADEMLNMGFINDIETILDEVPVQDRQTVLFSATMPRAILGLTNQYQRDAVHVKVASHDQPIAKVEQTYLELTRKEKGSTLIKLLTHHQFERSLVFCNTKWMVDELVKKMQSYGFAADGLHGGMPQGKRTNIMYRFKTGKTSLLIATDVASRGIDVNNIEAVFNYDLPKEPEFYIHRVGRTGRAGKAGSAFTFVEKRDFGLLKRIQRSPNVNLTQQFVPNAVMPERKITEQTAFENDNQQEERAPRRQSFRGDRPDRSDRPSRSGDSRRKAPRANSDRSNADRANSGEEKSFSSEGSRKQSFRSEGAGRKPFRGSGARPNSSRPKSSRPGTGGPKAGGSRAGNGRPKRSKSPVTA